MAEKDYNDIRGESIRILFCDAEDIASQKLGTRDPAIIASCMTLLELFDLEEKLLDISRRLKSIEDAQTAYFNNDIALREAEKRKKM